MDTYGTDEGGERRMKKLTTWLQLGLVASTLLLPQLVVAQGLIPTAPFAGTSGSGLMTAIRTIINVLLIFASLVAVIMIIYGGVRYMISRGDEDEAAAAKNTILYAVIGLIVIGLSAAIVNFVIGAISGVNLGGA